MWNPSGAQNRPKIVSGWPVRDVINLLSDDDERSYSQESLLDSSPNQSNDMTSEHFSCDNSTFSYYAQDDSKAKPPDLSKCFTLEELKNLGRMLKVSHGLTTVSICLPGSIVMTYGRRELHIEALLALACVQTTLGSYFSARPHFTYQRPKLP